MNCYKLLYFSLVAAICSTSSNLIAGNGSTNTTTPVGDAASFGSSFSQNLTGYIFIGTTCLIVGGAGVKLTQYLHDKYTQKSAKEAELKRKEHEEIEARNRRTQALKDFESYELRYSDNIQELNDNQSSEDYMKSWMEADVYHRHTGVTDFRFFAENRQLLTAIEHCNQLKEFVNTEEQEKINKFVNQLTVYQKQFVGSFRDRIQDELLSYEGFLHQKELEKANFEKIKGEVRLHEALARANAEAVKKMDAAGNKFESFCLNAEEKQNEINRAAQQFEQKMENTLQIFSETFVTKEEAMASNALLHKLITELKEAMSLSYRTLLANFISEITQVKEKLNAQAGVASRTSDMVTALHAHRAAKDSVPSAPENPAYQSQV